MNKTYTEEQLKTLFKHHPPSDEQIKKYKEIRGHETQTYKLINHVFSSPLTQIAFDGEMIQKITFGYACAINELCPWIGGEVSDAIECVLMVKHALIEHVYQRIQEEPGNHPIQGIGAKQRHLKMIAAENCFKARVLACRAIALAGVDGDEPC